MSEGYAEYNGLALADLGRAMEEVRKQLDTAKEVKTELEKRYDYIVSVLVPKAMEESGLTAMKLESGKGVRVQDEVFVSLNSANFEEFRNWLGEQGDASIVRETINPSTLKSYIVGRIKNGQEYPDSLIKVSIVPKARFY